MNTQGKQNQSHLALKTGTTHSPFDEWFQWLLDLDSTKCTKLNENLITPFQPYVLSSGEQIRIGQLELSVGLTYPALGET